MASTFTEGFESGTNGTTITLATTSFIAISAQPAGGTYAFDNTRSAHDTQSLKVAIGTTAGTEYAHFHNSDGTMQQWFRSYYYFTANPAINMTMIYVADVSAVRISRLEITTAGMFELQNAAGNPMCNLTTAMPLNQWFRVEGYIVANASLGQLSLSLYSTMDSTTATQTVSVVGQNTGSASPYDWQLAGTTTSVSSFGPFWIDDVGVSGAGALGPASNNVSLPVAFTKSANNGKKRGIGAATASVTLATTVIGASKRNGAASQAAALSTTVVEKHNVSQPVAFGSSAVGIPHRVGAATTAVAFSTSPAGSKHITASASTAVAFSTSSAGGPRKVGAVSASVSFGTSSAGIPHRYGTPSLAISLSTTQTGTKKTAGAPSIAIAFSTSSSGTKKTSGAASQAVAFSSSVVTAQRRIGAVSRAVAFSTSLVSSKRTAGSVTQAVAFSESATGVAHRVGAASIAVAFATSSTGTKKGTGLGTLILAFSTQTSEQNIVLLTAVFGTSATGLSRRNGAASLSIALGVSSSGITKRPGAVSVAAAFAVSAAENHNVTQPVAFGTSAAGKSVRHGATSQAVAFGASSAGKKRITVTVSQPVVFSSSAVAVAHRIGAVSQAVAFSNSAAAALSYTGAASVNVMFTGSSLGKTVKHGAPFIAIGFSTSVNIVNFVSQGVAFSTSASGGSRRNGAASRNVSISTSVTGSGVRKGIVTPVSIALSDSSTGHRQATAAEALMLSLGASATSPATPTGNPVLNCMLTTMASGSSTRIGVVTLPVAFDFTSIVTPRDIVIAAALQPCEAIATFQPA